METRGENGGQTVIEKLKLTFPRTYECFQFVFNGIDELIYAIDNSMPKFDFYLFLNLMSKYLCICLFADYSLLAVACPVLFYQLTKSESKSQTTNSNDLKDSEVQGQQTESRDVQCQQTQNSESQYQQTQTSEIQCQETQSSNIQCPQSASLPTEESSEVKIGNVKTHSSSPVIDFVVQFFGYYGRSLFINYLSGYMVVFMAVIAAFFSKLKKIDYSKYSQAAIEGYNKAQQNIRKCKIRELVSKLPATFDAPELARMVFLNRAIMALWPQMTPYLKELVMHSFPEALKPMCDLKVEEIKTIDQENLPIVLSSNFKEKTLTKVVLDVTIYYIGNYPGLVKWGTGEEFKYESFQIEAKLQLEFKYVNRVSQGVVLSEIVFHLKHINKIDVRLNEIASPLETVKPIKKLFLSLVQDVIQNSFPCFMDVLPDEVEDGNVDRETDVVRQYQASLERDWAAVSRVSADANSAGTGGTPVRQRGSQAASVNLDLNSTDNGSPVRQGENQAAVMTNYADGSLRKTVNLDLNSTSNGSIMNEESMESSTLGSQSSAEESDTNLGCVELTTLFQPPRTLVVTVHSLRNLPKKKRRVPNPYVKLYLQDKDQDEQKDSTNILEKTSDPVFDKSFAFRLKKPLSEYTLKVSAKTKHKLHHQLGQVVLCFAPSPSSQMLQERQWYDLDDGKKEPVMCRVEYQDATENAT